MHVRDERVEGNVVDGQAVNDADIITIPIDEHIRVLGARLHRLGWWSKFVLSLAQKTAGQVAAAFGVVEVLGIMRRRLFVVLYDAHSRSVLESSVGAWEAVSVDALRRISVVEMPAHHFALGGGSSGICQEGSAALARCWGNTEVVWFRLSTAPLTWVATDSLLEVSTPYNYELAKK